MVWRNVETAQAAKYKCAYCGNLVAAHQGYRSDHPSVILICPHCDSPTYVKDGTQIPDVAPGNEVGNLPQELEDLYREARQCVSVSAYTASVLACRKLLMNIAVTQGAKEGKSFASYVQHLADKGFIPPNGHGWVDHIRKKGNEATHEIKVMSREDAEELISFAEMLMKFIYEFPSKIPGQET